MEHELSGIGKPGNYGTGWYQPALMGASHCLFCPDAFPLKHSIHHGEEERLFAQRPSAVRGQTRRVMHAQTNRGRVSEKDRPAGRVSLSGCPSG